MKVKTEHFLVIMVRILLGLKKYNFVLLHLENFHRRDISSKYFRLNNLLRVNAYKNGLKSPINGTSRKIDFACILSIDRS